MTRQRLVVLGPLLLLTAAAGAQMPAFEAATVKRNLSGARGTETLFQAAAFRAQNQTVRELVRYAYGLQSFRIVGGPDWVDDERFDVIGTAADQATRDLLALMLRTLLIERFSLRAHPDVRELPIYQLVVARGDRRLGTRLRPASPAECRPSGPSWQAGQPPRCGALLQNPGMFLGRSVTLDQLATDLSQGLDRLVIDRTELAGRFDLDLRWEPSLTNDQAPALFTALQEQLGLKLEGARAPVEVVVIDSVERPRHD